VCLSGVAMIADYALGTSRCQPQCLRVAKGLLEHFARNVRCARQQQEAIAARTAGMQKSRYSRRTFPIPHRRYQIAGSVSKFDCTERCLLFFQESTEQVGEL
jgi:hypothetical protein